MPDRCDAGLALRTYAGDKAAQTMGGFMAQVM